MSVERSMKAGALRLAVAAAVMLAGTAHATEADSPAWQAVGRMGLVQYVIVPESQARDAAYYQTIIRESCPPAGTCFLRFFTNSQNVPAELPLPDAIQHEATALYQRSAKRGDAEYFRFSCRLQVGGSDCF